MTPPTEIALRWTCSRCGVSVGRMDGEQVSLPESWEACGEGDFCLSCRRQRAGDAAQAAAPDGCNSEVRAKARRAGLIEFEVRRTPDLTNNTIARACRTTAAAVAAARQRLQMGEAPPPGTDSSWATRHGATVGRRVAS